MKILKRLWADEVGAILSAELILMGTLLVIGLIVGLATLRDHVIQEVADIAGAIGDLDQSYSYSTTTGHNSIMRGADFVDEDDACDGADLTGDGANNDDSGDGAQCVSVKEGASDEGTAP